MDMFFLCTAWLCDATDVGLKFSKKFTIDSFLWWYYQETWKQSTIFCVYFCQEKKLSETCWSASLSCIGADIPVKGVD